MQIENRGHAGEKRRFMVPLYSIHFAQVNKCDIDISMTEAQICPFMWAWGDIVTNLTNEQTGIIITPQYYSNKNPDQQRQRENQMMTYSVRNNRGRNFSFNYTVTEGNNLKVDVFISKVDWPS